MSGLTTDAPRLLQANYQRLPFFVNLGIIGSLQWMFYFRIFSLSKTVYPTFFAVYLSLER